MAEWTPAMVRGPARERGRRVAVAARGEAAGLLQRMARVFPQLRRQGRSGASDAPPRPGRATIAQAEDAMLWLRWLDPADARLRLAPGEPQAVETDLLGARHQPRHREPALAIRGRGDHLAAERGACRGKRSMEFVVAERPLGCQARRPVRQFRRDTGRRDGSPF